MKKCKTCGKEIITKFPSKTKIQTFCSYKCAWEKQKVRKDKKCKVCNKIFYPQYSIQKFCSMLCRREDAQKLKDLTCKRCSKNFKGIKHKNFTKQYCSKECHSSDQSEKRMGKNNPGYRNGFAVTGKRTYTGLHLRACSKYRKAFLANHSYPFCEVCKTTNTMKFEVHHIYYASRVPRHPNLHNFKNLIHICIQCHNDFHAGRRKKDFERLEKERGLKQLFATSLSTV